MGKSGERRTRRSLLDAAARRKRLLCGVLCAALGCARASRPPKAPESPAEAHREAHAEAHARTGGAKVIARVGDTAVVALTGASFAALPRSSRLLAFRLAQAARQGDAIAWDQSYRHALEVARLLRGILQYPSAVEPDLLERVRLQARRMYLARGMHDPVTELKLPVAFTAAELRRAALSAQAAGADLGLGNARLEPALRALEGPLFDPRLDALRSARPIDGDALLASAGNLYQGVSLRDLADFREEHEANSRLVKSGGQLVEQVYRTGPAGLYGAELERAAAALDQAQALASGSQRDWLAWLATALRSGSAADLHSAQIAHAQAAGEVDAALGFLARGADPRGLKGLWLGAVGVVDPERSSPLRALASAFLELEAQTPWPDEYKRHEAAAPVPSALWLVSSAGADRPASFAGLRDGQSALLFPELDDAAATARDLRATEELAPPGSSAELLRCRAQVRLAVVALREVIGRASGTPPALPLPLELQEHAAVLEEARAELVAHWHGTAPKLVDAGLLADPRCQDSWPELAALSWLEALVRVEAGDRLDSAELRATQLMLWWFTQRHALQPRSIAGKTYLIAPDRKLFRSAAGSLLSLLQIIRVTGDATLLRGLIEAHGSRLDPALRDELRLRLDAQGIPRRVAVLAPVLRPVLEGGQVVDAQAAPVEDLDAQVLLDWAAF